MALAVDTHFFLVCCLIQANSQKEFYHRSNDFF